MKKSTVVTLVLSGTLAGGCDSRGAADDWSTEGATPTVTNNTYVPGRGYYHAPYHGWFPYPFNCFRPGLGYYHGGRYTATPEAGEIIARHPPALTRGAGAGDGLPTSAHAISRGGFGLTGHGGS
jgi:hypothetical protein